MVDKSDRLVKEIKDKALEFVMDNMDYSEKNVLMIQSAMFIGANVALTLELAEEKGKLNLLKKR